MALGGGVYIAKDAEAGLVAYGGILMQDGDSVTVVTKDAVKRRVYIGPLRLLIEVDAGIVEKIVYDVEAGTVDIYIVQVPGGPVAHGAVIWADSRTDAVWAIADGETEEARGGWRVPLRVEGVTVRLQAH